jgi:hypothetical protein
MQGDGDCDNQCNNAECNFDDGDCNDPCSPNPCQNGGTCQPKTSTTSNLDYLCNCERGWCGAHCTTAEDLNAYDLSNNQFCKGKLRDCKDEFPESDVYFCCEQLIATSNWTCHQAVDAVQMLRLSIALLVGVL